MPISQNGVGHSRATKNKQECLEKIISQILSVIRVIQGKRSYVNDKVFYIDTNAGPGYNLEENCDGSPIVFLKVATRLGLEYQAHFIEINEESANTLREAIKSYPNCFVHNGDNRSVLDTVPYGIPKNTFGILYMDANGIPDFSLLERVSRMPRMKTIDIVIRIPGAAIKRNYSEIGTLIAMIKSIHKSHWIIKEIDSVETGWQWSMLIGLNTKKMRPWESQGFYSIDSEKGQQILEQLAYTKNYLKKKRQLESGQMILPGFLLTRLTGNTLLTLSFEQLDVRPLKDVWVSARNAISDLLRKFTI